MVVVVLGTDEVVVDEPATVLDEEDETGTWEVEVVEAGRRMLLVGVVLVVLDVDNEVGLPVESGIAVLVCEQLADTRMKIETSQK